MDRRYRPADTDGLSIAQGEEGAGSKVKRLRHLALTSLVMWAVGLFNPDRPWQVARGLQFLSSENDHFEMCGENRFVKYSIHVSVTLADCVSTAANNWLYLVSFRKLII